MPITSRINGPLLSTCVDHFRRGTDSVGIDEQTLLDLNSKFQNSRFNVDTYTLEELFSLVYCSPTIANNLFRNKRFVRSIKAYRAGDKKIIARNSNFNLELALNILEQRYHHDLRLVSHLEKMRGDKKSTAKSTQNLFFKYVADAKIDIEFAKANFQFLLERYPEACISIKFGNLIAPRIKTIVEMDKSLNDLYFKAIDRARKHEVLKNTDMAHYVQVANINYLIKIMNPSTFDRIGAVFRKVASLWLSNGDTNHEYVTAQMLINRIIIEFSPDAPGLEINFDKLKLISSFLERRIIGKNYWQEATREEWSTIIYILKINAAEGTGEVNRLLQLAKTRYAKQFKVKLPSVEAEWSALPAPRCFVRPVMNLAVQPAAPIVQPQSIDVPLDHEHVADSSGHLAEDEAPPAPSLHQPDDSHISGTVVQGRDGDTQSPVARHMTSPASGVRIPRTPVIQHSGAARQLLFATPESFNDELKTAAEDSTSALEKLLVSPQWGHQVPFAESPSASGGSIKSSNRFSPPSAGTISATISPTPLVRNRNTPIPAPASVTVASPVQPNPSNSSPLTLGDLLVSPASSVQFGSAATPESQVPRAESSIIYNNVPDSSSSESPLFHDLFNTPQHAAPRVNGIKNGQADSVRRILGGLSPIPIAPIPHPQDQHPLVTDLPGLPPSPRLYAQPLAQPVPQVEVPSLQLPIQDEMPGLLPSPRREEQPAERPAVQNLRDVEPLVIPLAANDVPGLLPSPRREAPEVQTLPLVEASLAPATTEDTAPGLLPSPRREVQLGLQLSPNVVPALQLALQDDAPEDVLPGLPASPRQEVSSEVEQPVVVPVASHIEEAAARLPQSPAKTVLPEVRSPAVVPSLPLPVLEEVPGLPPSPRQEVSLEVEQPAVVPVAAHIEEAAARLPQSPAKTILPEVRSHAVVPSLELPEQEEVPGLPPSPRVGTFPEEQALQTAEVSAVPQPALDDLPGLPLSPRLDELPGLLSSPMQSEFPGLQPSPSFAVPGLDSSPQQDAAPGLPSSPPVGLPPSPSPAISELSPSDIPGLPPSPPQYVPEVNSNVVPPRSSYSGISTAFWTHWDEDNIPADAADMQSPAYVSPSALPPRATLPPYNGSPCKAPLPGIFAATPPNQIRRMGGNAARFIAQQHGDNSSTNGSPAMRSPSISVAH